MAGPDSPSDRCTIRGRRRAAAKEKGTDTVCRMVREAQKAGIPFDFVLFDTWFSNPARLVELKGMETDTIAMIRKNSINMIPSVERFKNSDNRSLEDLFYGVQCEIVNELIDCAIVLMIDTLLDSVREYCHTSETQLAELVCLFISKLPENWKIRFQMPKAA